MRNLLLAAVLLSMGSTAAAGSTATLDVDLTEAGRGIQKAHVEWPVKAGPITLVYPKWLPGRHSPAGPATSLNAPVITGNGVRIPFRRDAIDPYAFHLTVPDGVDRLSVDLEVLSAAAPDGIVQGMETPRYATDALAILEWNQVLVYPQGTPTDRLEIKAAVTLPAQWSAATALEAEPHSGGAFRYRPVTLTTLVDSPLIAAAHLRRYPLSESPSIELDLTADHSSAGVLSAERIGAYRRLVAEAQSLFGGVHFDHYRFLWTLTDQIMEDGLEHHQSSDNRSPLWTLRDPDLFRSQANLLAHEFVHSWNGKFRRPQGLATEDFQVPMRTDLLWVYEGLTEYLGNVLAVRSGLLSETEFRDELARLAAQMEIHHGRNVRSLQDTTDAAPLLYYQDRTWASRLRRQDDFYQESALLWLEADVTIRRLSHGARSLDDFCRTFFGGTTLLQVVPYTFEDLVAALSAVQPYDWRGFWTNRLSRLGGGAPMGGIEGGGWVLGWQDEPTSMHRAHEKDDRAQNLQYSLGFQVAEEGGVLSDIVPGSPADLAGLAPGSHLIAAQDRRYTPELLNYFLADRDPSGLALLIEKDDVYQRVLLKYADGPRYPALQRGNGDDLIAHIARPRAHP
jgi:predicted metalloprotease with PDZ domain